MRGCYTEHEQYPEMSGLVVPVCTPFDENDAIEEGMYVKHLGLLAGQGVKRILVNGTTAEFFSLTVQERKRLMELSRRHFDGVLIFHAGCDGLAQTTELAKYGQDSGADAIAAIAPYYMASVSEQGMIDYFNALADTIKVPFILYNFPKHTQNGFTPEILSKIKHFGMKDSSADL